MTTLFPNTSSNCQRNIEQHDVKLYMSHYPTNNMKEASY